MFKNFWRKKMATHPSLFRTVPSKDYFHLFNDGIPDGEKVVKLLKYKKEDVSIATNIPITSIRFDNKMPTELKMRLTEWATALNLVAGFFKDDQEKTLLWFCIANPLLGGMSPSEMIRIGRFKKLLNFIQTALDENLR